MSDYKIISKKKFGFKEQMYAGDKGEALFKKAYKKVEKPIKTDGRKFDFYVNETETAEIKTDTYSMSKTKNFFMERFSSTQSKKPGGPWRAAEDDVDYFIYLFISDNVFYWFEPKALSKFLDDYIKSEKPIFIRNKGWETEGYKVKREDIAHLCSRKDVFDGKKLISCEEKS